MGSWSSEQLLKGLQSDGTEYVCEKVGKGKKCKSRGDLAMQGVFAVSV